MDSFMIFCLANVFVAGSRVSLFDVVRLSASYLSSGHISRLICTPLFGGYTESYDDEEGTGFKLYSRSGMYIGGYYDELKKTQRGETPYMSIKLDAPLLRLSMEPDGPDFDDIVEDDEVIEVLKGKFLTLRGLVVLSRSLVSSIGVQGKTAYIPDVDYLVDTCNDGALETRVEQPALPNDAQ